MEDKYGEEYETIEEVKNKIEQIKMNGCDEDGCEYGELCEDCEADIQELERMVENFKNEEKEKWEEAKEEFIARAIALGYDSSEVMEALDNNWSHGAYMQEHGSCSNTILENWDEKENRLRLDEIEIKELIESMEIARERHEDTDYDELRKSGIDCETARELK